jgi:glycosyltransferase involved in cell wall biosynthesis
MRILMLSSVEHQSGSGLRFRGIAGALARRGHQVHLLEPVPAGGDAETPPGVVRQPCPRLPVRPEWQAPLWLAHGIAASRRVRPDVAYALKPLPNAWLPAALAGRGGARVAVDFDDLDHAYYPAGAARALVERCFRAAARTADDATCHNDAMRALLTRIRGEERAPVWVEQAVDADRFAGVAPDPALRERLGLGHGPVLLYAGHLGPASDLGALLPALAPIAAERPDARLLIVGDGRDRPALEAAARALPRGFAVFAGAVPHREVARYHALADVALGFLRDTEANRFRASIKIREAIAAGLPVVATRLPDSERLAPYLRLAEPGADAFVQALRTELAAPDRARALAGAETLRRQATFDAAVEAIAARWEGRA